MRSLFRKWRLGGWAILVVLSIALWSWSLDPTSAHLPHPSFKISFNSATVAPFGIAATPSRLLVTVCGAGGIQVLSVGVDTGGVDPVAAATQFAFISGVCLEPDIAIAPATPGLSGHFFPSRNAAGFISNYVYVTQPTSLGLQIWEIGVTVQADGSVGAVDPVPFVLVSGCVGPTSHGDITFSRVIPELRRPSFGPHGTMLVSCTNGLVWTVTVLRPSPGEQTVVATQVGNVRALIEGPDVAPLTFDAGPGYVFFGSEADNLVYSLSPRGQVRRVVSWPAANGVDFVAKPKCDYLASEATYFTIVSPQVPSVGAPAKVWKFPQADFSGLGGVAALVTRGFGPPGLNGIGLLTSAKGGSITAFHPFEGDEHRGSTFVYCDPTLLSIDVEPQSEITDIAWGSNGLVTVVIHGSATFDVNNVVVSASSLTFGWTGDERSFDHCTEGKKDLNGDTFLDLECKFRIAQLGVPLADQNPGVQLILKGLYNAPTGDPPFEGFD